MSKFFKHKLARVELKLFVVFEKFTTAYHTKLHVKSYCYLLVIYINNTSQTVTTDENWQHVLVLQHCTRVTYLYSEEHNFSVYFYKQKVRN